MLIFTRSHVFRDLQPYICTFGGCPKQETLFESRNEWFHHELQTHRRDWLCNDCDYTSLNRDEFENHQRQLHLKDFTEAQISTLAETCQKPLDTIPLLDCPLCDSVEEKTLSAANFRRHLGRHCEIGLFILSKPGSMKTDYINCSGAVQLVCLTTN